MKTDYTGRDIQEALQAVGICLGDDVFIHSNLGFFGMLEGCRSANDICEGFLTAIKDVVGAAGTVAVPTFSYSYCHGEVYDPYETRTGCGMLSEYVRQRFPENRTLDPNFSICGLGAHMEEYKQCNIHESFGCGSFWEVFMKNKGKIICMNFDAGSTFIHFIERKNDVPYRYNKAFNGETLKDGRLQKDYAVHFVFEGEADAPCMERVDALCREHHIFKQVNLGKGTILAFPVQEYFTFFSDLLKRRPRVLCRKEGL